jgi:hypothetical protein
MVDFIERRDQRPANTFQGSRHRLFLRPRLASRVDKVDHEVSIRQGAGDQVS